MKRVIASAILTALLGAVLAAQGKPPAAPPKEPLPELWLRAQGQPVEIAAYVFKQLNKTGKIPAGGLGECQRALSEKALSGSGPWYPRLPASTNIAAGYSGRAMAFHSGLDRLGIYVEAGAPQAMDPAARWLEFLATSLSRPRSPVTCRFPTVEIGRSAFQRVALLAKDRAAKEPEKVETVVSAAQQYVGSPWEIGGFLEIIEALPEGARDVHWNRIGGLFRTLSPQPTGSVLYLRNAEFFSALQRLAKARPGGFVAVQDDLRGFVIRQLAQPLCEVDAGAQSGEMRSRQALMKRYNEFVAAAGGTAQLISEKEIEEIGKKRKVLSEKALDLSAPGDVEGALKALGAAMRSAEATSDERKLAADKFIGVWREWAARPDGDDASLAFDAKVGLLIAAVQGAPLGRPDATAAFLQSASNHSVKKTDPGVWTGLVLTLLQVAEGGRAFGGKDPVDTAMIEQIRRTAKDPAIVLLLEASLLDIPELR